MGRDESLPVLRGALKDPNAEIRRGAVLALSDWPNTKPMPDLLEIAGTDASPALQVLSLQGYIRLIGIPDNRPPADTVRMLSDAIHRAKRAEEKRAALSLLQRINTPEALAVAEDAIKDQDVSGEAKAAPTESASASADELAADPLVRGRRPRRPARTLRRADGSGLPAPTCLRC